MESGTFRKPLSGEVHVWAIALEATPGNAVGCLSRPEIARLNNLAPSRSQTFAVTHCATRQILARYFEVSPSEVRLNSPYGCAPTVPGLALSLSHADGLALLAVSGCRVGIDLEPIKHAFDDDLELLAIATLTDAELEEFMRTGSDGRPLSWLRSWVRKEASLKALGEGISDRAPAEVDVSSDPDGLLLNSLDLGPEFIGALATDRFVKPPAIREWSLEQE